MTAGETIDVHLADGGHVIVAFADPSMEADPGCDGIVTELIHADGSEHDLERAVVDRAAAAGLSATVSTGRHPTIVVIDRPIATDGVDADRVPRDAEHPEAPRP
jgi:hypothetical protein